MSSPQRHKFPLRNSLYIWVLLALASTLVCSFLVYRAITRHVEELTVDPVFSRLDKVQIESGLDAYHTEGKEGLRRYMANLDRILGAKHHLLDTNGVEMVTGRDYSANLPPKSSGRLNGYRNGHWQLSHWYPDAQVWFLVDGQDYTGEALPYLPYYLLVIGATVGLGVLAGVWVISPLRRIAATIARFGQGDLSVRLPVRRRDEIGQLGASFNQMAERLERLIVSEHRLLSDISHELRSPLARLTVATKLARTSPDREAALDRIQREVERMTSLVADIVEINLAEDDPLLKGLQPADLGAIVNEVVGTCTMEAEARNCRLEMEGRMESILDGSPELLRRAIENVLRNAIRYAPEGTPVYLTLGADEGQATITIRDLGPGVPEEMLTRIFDPFFRVEEARDRHGSLSCCGLGLSIARRAVQLHHGTIAAENAGPGLRVRIALPLPAAAVPA